MSRRYVVNLARLPGSPGGRRVVVRPHGCPLEAGAPRPASAAAGYRFPLYVRRDGRAAAAAEVCRSCPSGQFTILPGCGKPACGALAGVQATARLMTTILEADCPLGHHAHLKPPEGPPEGADP